MGSENNSSLKIVVRYFPILSFFIWKLFLVYLDDHFKYEIQIPTFVYAYFKGILNNIAQLSSYLYCPLPYIKPAFVCLFGALSWLRLLMSVEIWAEGVHSSHSVLGVFWYSGEMLDPWISRSSLHPCAVVGQSTGLRARLPGCDLPQFLLAVSVCVCVCVHRKLITVPGT